MRKFRGWAAGVITAIACTMTIFQLYTGGIQALPAQWQRGVHLGFGIVLVFLLFPPSKKEKIANSNCLYHPCGRLRGSAAPPPGHNLKGIFLPALFAFSSREQKECSLLLLPVLARG